MAEIKETPAAAVAEEKPVKRAPAKKAETTETVDAAAKKPATKKAPAEKPVAEKAEKAVEKPVAAKKAPAEKKAALELRLKTRYNTEVGAAMSKTFGYTNVMQVPRMEKITLNLRLGDIKDNAKSMQLAVAELEKISGYAATSALPKLSSPI